MAIKVLVGSEFINMVSVYAPQIVLPDDVKKQFWEDLDMIIQDVPQSEKFFIGGDFNGHIGVHSDGYDSAHGGFGFGERNIGGVYLLDFAVAFDLPVINSFFKKKEHHLVTFKSGLSRTQIDYFLIRADNRRLCKDCKVIPNELLGTQHRLLVLDMEFKCSKGKQRRVGDPRVKWWTLTKENAMLLAERIAEEGAWRQVEDADIMWEAMADSIRKSARLILCSSRRGGNKMKGAWWWNEEVKEKVKEKKEAYAVFMNSGGEEEREICRGRHKATKKVAKKAVAVAKCRAYDRLYRRLETKEGEKKVFKLARARKDKQGI